MYWITPSPIFLKLFRVKTAPANISFTPRRRSSPQEPDLANRGGGCLSIWILLAVIHIWTMSAVGTEILFQWKNHSLLSPWSSQKMLCFVPLDTPIGEGDILSGDRPIFLLVGSMLVFLGTEMALGVSGLASFHIHNGKVNWGQPSGLIPISSTDGLFYFGSTFSALG